MRTIVNRWESSCGPRCRKCRRRSFRGAPGSDDRSGPSRPGPARQRKSRSRNGASLPCADGERSGPFAQASRSTTRVTLPSVQGVSSVLQHLSDSGDRTSHGAPESRSCHEHRRAAGRSPAESAPASSSTHPDRRHAARCRDGTDSCDRLPECFRIDPARPGDMRLPASPTPVDASGWPVGGLSRRSRSPRPGAGPPDRPCLPEHAPPRPAR